MPVVLRSFGLEIIQNGTYFFQIWAIFNMARLLLDDFRNECEKGPWWQHLFNGYSITTWLVMLDLGSTGFLFSWSMTICKGDSYHLFAVSVLLSVSP